MQLIVEFLPTRIRRTLPRSVKLTKVLEEKQRIGQIAARVNNAQAKVDAISGTGKPITNGALF
jgi:hypothetical protein